MRTILTSTIGSRVVRVLVAIVIAGILSSLLFWASGANPIDAYAALFRGSFGTLYGFEETITQTGILILMAVAVALPSRAQLWNIGGEGQMFMGALAAAMVALGVPGPPALITVLALVVASVVGGLWAGLAGILKARWGANEVLTTLMLNFIAILIVDYYISEASITSGIPNATRFLPDGVALPVVIPGTSINLTIVIALGAAVLAHLILSRTSFGLQTRALGGNRNATVNMGAAVPRLQAGVMSVGGVFAGLAGAVIVIGVQGLLVRGFSPGFGFTGIAIAIMALGKPLWTIPSALLFAALTVGGSYLEPAVGVSSSAALVVQAMLLLSLLACWAFPPGRIGAGR